MLEQCTELFTADTIMGWYRELVAQKYDGSENRTSPGRPQIGQEIVTLVIRFKEENPRWGYQKITDQIVYLGHKISKSSVKNILIENGYDPEPDLTVRSSLNMFLGNTASIFIMSVFINRWVGSLNPSTRLKQRPRLPASNAWVVC
jgi:hypothetical protein